MGACDSFIGKSKYNKRNSNIGKQPYSAPVNDLYNNDSPNLGNTISTISQMSLMSPDELRRKKPSPLYKYTGTYYKKDEQTSLMTASLYEMQNSLTNNKTKNSINKNIMQNNNSILDSCIDENEKESCSSEVLEIINDGKMDESMLQKSTDKTTMDSYNEFIGKKNLVFKKNKVDIYRKNCVKNNGNNRYGKVGKNEDIQSEISGIPSSTLSNSKIGKKF